jgi:hypothetical protein
MIYYKYLEIFGDERSTSYNKICLDPINASESTCKLSVETSSNEWH